MHIDAGSNNVSVAEDEVLRILILLRNFLPAHQQIRDGGWDVAAVAGGSFDLQNKVVGTVGGGRIGWELMKRLRVRLAPGSCSCCMPAVAHSLCLS